MKKKCGGKCGGAKIAWILVIIGALNWGLVGIGGFAGANWNVVNLILGSISWLEYVVYILVGLSGIMLLVKCKCKTCKDGSCDAGAAPAVAPAGGSNEGGHQM